MCKESESYHRYLSFIIFKASLTTGGWYRNTESSAMSQQAWRRKRQPALSYDTIGLDHRITVVQCASFFCLFRVEDSA
jgi:hypothetical protein